MSQPAPATAGPTPKKVCTFSMGIEERDMIRWLLEGRGIVLIRMAAKHRLKGRIENALIHERELEWIFSSLRCMEATKHADRLHARQMEASYD